MLQHRTGSRQTSPALVRHLYQLFLTVPSAIWLAGIAQDYSALKKFAESEEWIANVVRFYLDKIDEDQLPNIANDAPQEKECNERLCESHGFIGLKYDSK